MKKNPLSYTFLSGLLTFSGGVYANCNAEYCQGPAQDIIKAVYLNYSGDVRVEGPADMSELECSPIAGKYIAMKRGEHPSFAEIYSALLTSSATNKVIRIRKLDSRTDCEIAYVIMYN